MRSLLVGAVAVVPLLTALLQFVPQGSGAFTLSTRLIHRFSDEARLIEEARTGTVSQAWPAKGSLGYYAKLVRRDLVRRGSKYKTVHPSEGSDAVAFGDEFGWLHYTWIDIGTPNVSFLVALDAGSDLTWLPCDCVQCASLSDRGNSLDRDLNMYSPAKSSTSKYLACGNELCQMASSCKSPKQPCPYNVSYYSENTSSSGILVEDILYLASDDNNSLIQTAVVVGCGMEQTGVYMDGIAPDGLLGLGLGDISIPTFLAKKGVVGNSFSICFRDDDSGKILFGDQGSSQQSTPLLPLNGKFVTYIVEVEAFCVGRKCLEATGMQALVDSGSSFSFVPANIYKVVTSEFDRQMNSTRLVLPQSPWEYCYQSSSLETPKIPQLTLMFAVNKSFMISNPIFLYYGDQGGIDGFCLALQSSSDTIGIIGQNLMTGYRLSFDRDNLKMGWSRSDCNDLDNNRRMPLTSPSHDRPENPLPTNEQQSSPNAHAVSPAVAGRAPLNPSAATVSRDDISHFGYLQLLILYAFADVLGG